MRSLKAIIFLSFTIVFNFQNIVVSQTGVSNNSIELNDAKAIKKIVKSWSLAHEQWDFECLKRLYADTLIFYTQKISAAKALSKITGMFRPSEAFKHKIISDIDLKVLENSYIKCNFTKEVTINGKTKSYPSYLVIDKQNEKYFVVAEGDYITDKNLNYDYEESVSKLTGTNHQTSKVVRSYKWLYILVFLILISGVIFIFYKRKFKTIPSNSDSQQPQNEKSGISNDNISTKSEIDINKQKGDDFEKYIIGKFDTNYFTSLHWRSDKAAHGHFPKSNSDPDMEFEFAHRNYSRKFAIECKYRSNFKSGYVELCENYKLQRYKTFEAEKQMQVYIVLGVGGQPTAPEELFIIPLPYLNSNKISRNQLVNEHRKSLHSKFFYDTDIHMLT